MTSSPLFLFFLIKKKRYLFIYIWLCWGFITARGLSLVAVSGGDSLTVVRRLLFGVASLAGEHSLQGTDPVVMAQGLGSSVACGIYSRPGIQSSTLAMEG